jgi:hypothetical protein
MKKEIKVAVGSNLDEIKNRGGYFEKFKNAPIPDNELLTNLGLFINAERGLPAGRDYWAAMPPYSSCGARKRQ